MLHCIHNKIFTIPAVLFLALIVLFAGCDDSGTSSNEEMGSMTVEMTDAPIESADAVHVFIEQVEVQAQDAVGGSGWVVLNEPRQRYDLLELVNGATAVIGTRELEPGTYDQIRLVLSEGENSIVVDGVEHDLKVPSGAQTGIKLNINAEIQPGIEYVLLLDFDASRSVVAAGQPGNPVQYLLKPVIMAKEKAITGSIAGEVDPAEAQPVIYAITGSDTLASTIADTSSGSFKLVGLEEDTYTISVNPRNSTYESTIVENVSVTMGETTKIETVVLSQQ